jgi:hypothetical protein
MVRRLHARGGLLAGCTATLSPSDQAAPLPVKPPAVPLYRQALAAGLTGSRRRQAVIQLASSLRELGEAGESVALLTAEMAVGSDELDDAVKAVLALSLADAGREREAVGIAVGALSAHLPRYQRSLAAYARQLLEPDPAADPEADVHS